MFVDEFNQEGSRDIEPMKAGHGDNYYYQLVDSVRRFKGCRPPFKSTGPKHIDVSGEFAQWNDVEPEYRDDLNDVAHRDSPGWNTVTRYVNTTGRNDIVACKVAYDDSFIYFYVKTTRDITAHADPYWMNLFIDADLDSTTGWEGFDFLVNY